MAVLLDIPISEQPKLVSRDGNSALFEVTGLYPGYGVTLGNALRRVLLSSLSGAAVTLVEIENIPHEFTTIPGVRETVLDLVLNLKRLRLKLFSDEPQVLTLEKKGAGKATSDDLKVPAQVSVTSKGMLIATLTDKKAELKMRLTVERGIGYVPAGSRSKEKIPVGSTAIDAIFTPVHGVNFSVENMRVGDRTDYNRLRIEVETDGTISPDEALARASAILVKQFSAIVPEEYREEEGASAAAAILKEPLAVLGLSGSTVTRLAGGGIRTVAGLVRKSEGDISAMKGVGKKAVDEVVRALAKHKLALKE